MIDFILDQMMTWWQFTVVAILIIIGFIINIFDKKVDEPRINFRYIGMPCMRPLPINTKSKGFWGAIWMWLTGTRHWVVDKDWKYYINGEKTPNT